MILDKVLSSSMQALPDCVLAVYIDLDMGMILSATPHDDGLPDAGEALAVTSVQLFNSAEAQAISAHQAGEGTPALVTEIMATSRAHQHLFLRLPNTPAHVVCYVCDKSAPLAEMLQAGRGTLPAYGGIFQGG